MSTSVIHPPSVAQLVPRHERAWYVVAWSYEVKHRPVQRKLWGRPLVLYRGQSGRVACFLDRCPHRNVPLSFGTVKGDRLKCGYHGWEFDTDGRCAHIPALIGEADAEARRAVAYPVVEKQGMIWVWADPEVVPDREPFHFAHADRDGYMTVRHDVQANGSVHAVAENALDVPHTAFLHGGLFRNDADRNRITARVKRWDDRVECEYIGEPRPSGLAGRILSPGGGVVTHFDRFYLPSIVEVEYSLGHDTHIVNAAALTPIDEFHTRLYAVVVVKSRVPAWLVRPFVYPLALRIFQQDAVVLKLQTETLLGLGEARFASTELDTVGPHILRLLRRASRGEPIDPDKEPYIKELALEV